jgi:hypothetical protein
MRFLLSIVVLAAAWTAGAQGTSQPAIQGYSNPIPGGALVSATAGWSFQPATTITVTELGCLADFFLNNPTASPLEVGLWNNSTSLLLASTFITPGSSNINQFLYESVTPHDLNPGITYSIGVYSSGGTCTLDIATPARNNGSVTTSPDILSLASAEGTGGFAVPTGGADDNVPNSAFLGPNFLYSGGIPEPSSGVLLALGGLLLAARRRIRRR